MLFESNATQTKLDGQFCQVDFDKKSLSTALLDNEPLAFDPNKLKQKRLAKVREFLKANDITACILFDPYNQRYATGSRNMFGYFLRNSTRYIYIPAEGEVILFEYPQSAHVSQGLGTIDQVRKSKIVWSSVLHKDQCTQKTFALEIKELMDQVDGQKKRVAMDRCFHSLANSLICEGVEVLDFMQDMLKIRSIKIPEEIKCLQISMINSEAAVAKVRENIRPGISEQELFAKMYEQVIAGGGEYIETRLLSSGERTNPWFNEASPKLIRPGELVALDTDTIGNYGYYCDFSRTFHCGPGKPTDEQKALYKMAYEQVQHNMEILRPGMTLREVSEKAWKIPQKYYDRRYTSVMHGCGMHGEAPFITHWNDFDEFGGDDLIRPGMVLCIESYIGELEGREGVKLEEQVLVTNKGIENFGQFPFEEELLN